MDKETSGQYQALAVSPVRLDKEAEPSFEHCKDPAGSPCVTFIGITCASGVCNPRFPFWKIFLWPPAALSKSLLDMILCETHSRIIFQPSPKDSALREKRAFRNWNKQ